MTSLLLLLSLVAAPQEPVAPELVVDGAPMTAVSARYSHSGWISVDGRSAAGLEFGLVLSFPPVDPPPPGRHAVGPDAPFGVAVGSAADRRRVQAGELVVDALGPQRAALALTWKDAGGDRRVEVDVVPKTVVPAFEARHLVDDGGVEPQNRPDREDLVFAVLGNAGTGLPGQRRVAAALARLAATGPLDFVLVLGNAIMPGGVASAQDPAWRSRFEDVYDERALAVPFYVVPGPAEWRGDLAAIGDRSRLSSRWTCDRLGMALRFAARGKSIELLGTDTLALPGPIPDPVTRSVLRRLNQNMEKSTADWKIVFAHHAIVADGGEPPPEWLHRVHVRCEPLVRRWPPDLIIAGAGAFMRLSTGAGIPLVCCGGSGGDEIGIEPPIVPGTEFAHGGAGFVWVRCTGDTLELSFRDADGQALFTKVWSK